jgi:Transposase
MTVTVQMQFTSAVTEMSQDAFVGSSMENGTTMIMVDLRKHDFHRELGTQATLAWRKEAYRVDGHELSTFHNPITYRCIFTQGSYLDAQNHRRSFTSEIQSVSTSQHVSHSVVRLACYLAVVCGVSLRPIVLLFSALCLLPTTKSSIKRWIDAIGVHVPMPEEMLQQLLARTPATECHIDGYYPLGTDHCVMVVQDEHDRILMTHEAKSENGEDARQFLQRLKDHGLQVTAAFSDYSQSFTEAIQTVFPSARFQADHFHTVKKALITASATFGHAA